MVARHLTLKNKVCWVRLTEGVARSIKDLTEREKPLLLKSKTNILSLECWQLERETRKYCPVAQLAEHATVNRGVEGSNPPGQPKSMFEGVVATLTLNLQYAGLAEW